MNITVPLPDSVALALHKHQFRSPSRHLGESFHAAHDEALGCRAAGDYPREITVSRGQRITGTIVPENMLANMTACETRAWSHSDLAGALWENGFRASRAIELAENSE